jgi:hypothetical protein
MILIAEFAESGKCRDTVRDYSLVTATSVSLSLRWRILLHVELRLFRRTDGLAGSNWPNQNPATSIDDSLQVSTLTAESLCPLALS